MKKIKYTFCICLIVFSSICFSENVKIEGIVYEINNGNKIPINGAVVESITPIKRRSVFTNRKGEFSIQIDNVKNSLLLVKHDKYIPELIIGKKNNKIRLLRTEEYFLDPKRVNDVGVFDYVEFTGKVLESVSKKPIQGALISLIGTPYKAVTDYEGLYQLKIRLDKFLLDMNNDLVLQLNADGCKTMIQPLRNIDLTKKLIYTQLNYDLERMYVLSSFENTISKAEVLIDSLNQINNVLSKIEIDSTSKIEHSLKEKALVFQEVDDLAKQDENIFRKIDSLKTGYKEEMEALKGEFNNCKLDIFNDRELQREDSIALLEVQNKNIKQFEDMTKALSDSSSMLKRYITDSNNSIKKSIGLKKADTIYSKLEMSFAPITFYSKNIPDNSEVLFPSYVSLQYKFSKLDYLSISSNYYLNDSVLGLFINYQVNPFLKKEIYGLIGIGVLNYFPEDKTIFAFQVALNWDLLIRKKYTLSASLNYQVSLEPIPDTANGFRSYGSYFNPMISVSFPLGIFTTNID